MATKNSCNEPTAASGKVLQGQGTGIANEFSTATYPSTATGTGKILRADGTNWVATTATYPDTAGTSGNILTSDGTNWSSSTPSSSVFFNGYLSTAQGNPADSVTYYLIQAVSPITTTSSSNPQVKYYVPAAFTLTKVYGVAIVAGTLGSAQNCTLFIRVNDTTNTNITTTLQLTAISNSFSNTGLSISLNAGDFFSFGFTGAAWGTNPTGVGFSIGWSS